MFELMRSLSIDGAAGRAAGEARLEADHPIFADHFPGRAILPATLAVELAAQVAGALAEELTVRRHGRERCAFLGMIRQAKVLAPTFLPADLVLEARLRRDEPSGMSFAVSASSGGERTLRGELFLALVDAEDGWEEAIRERKERVARLLSAAGERSRQ